MTLGERCDEIVRLIDETLTACTPATSSGLAPRRAKSRATDRANDHVKAAVDETLAQSA